jgi:hypothetical protein
MYNLAKFEEYTLRKHLGNEPVLAWSLKNGYHFLSFIERHTSVQDFKIIGVLKNED